MVTNGRFFGGEIAHINGHFDLSSLPALADGLFWNTSKLNAGGNWRLSVIPEPGTNVMIMIGLLAALAPAWLKNRSKNRS